MDDSNKSSSSNNTTDNHKQSIRKDEDDPFSLSSPIPKKKRPSNTVVTTKAATTTDNDKDDLLGHVPRKKSWSSYKHDLTSSSRDGASAAASFSTSQSMSGTKRPHASTSSSSGSNGGKNLPPPSSAPAGTPPTTRPSPRQSTPPPAPPLRRHYIQVVSEAPIILKIQTKDVPLTRGIPSVTTPSSSSIRRNTTSNGNGNPSSNSRMRQAKKSTVDYQEANLTDSDDFLTDTDEETDATKARRKKKRRLQPMSSGTTTTSTNVVTNPVVAHDTTAMTTTTAAAPTTTTNAAAAAATAPLVYAPTDAPPEGTLSTLWYSREVFLNILVMEKIVGWKTRPVVQLVKPKDGAEAATAEVYTLDAKEALRWQEKALQTPAFWNDTPRRMSVSRANPAQCPVLMQLAARAEAQRAAAEGRPPAFVVQSSSSEEVLLVKWRGRSHLHCSWERSVDIQRVDAGNNNTAKQKIKRFYQSQELLHGYHWKQVLQEDRDTATAIHSHGGSGTAVVGDGDGGGNGNGNTEATSSNNGEEEYFPVQCLELERILACDESEMNMNVLAVQRAKNALAEQSEMQFKEQQQEATHRFFFLLDHVVHAPEVSDTWDPEDNVRYVVKWKGLPYAEITWEYWRDIKRDAVDLAEDFWYRQQPPSAQELKDAVMTPHPSVRDFKKLQESPVYGISSRPRPVANVEGAPSPPPPPEEDENTFEGFRLRSYQLEGVNWLLFNWWNKRSCILADEMGLGTLFVGMASGNRFFLHFQPWGV